MKHVIFNSDACDYNFEEAKKGYMECMDIEDKEEVTDNAVWEHIHNDIEYWYEAECDNLDKELEGDIIAFGTVGRWNGSFSEYTVMGSNLKDILKFHDCDNIKVYMDRHGVHSIMYHHDGCHSMEFRVLRNDRNTDRFLDKVYSGTYTRNDVYNYTKSLRPIIKEVYGW